MTERPVHPNSMAARKWHRSTWRTSLSEQELAPPSRPRGRDRSRSRDVARGAERLFAQAAAARARGDHELAAALWAAGGRASTTEHRCS